MSNTLAALFRGPMTLVGFVFVEFGEQDKIWLEGIASRASGGASQ